MPEETAAPRETFTRRRAGSQEAVHGRRRPAGARIPGGAAVVRERRVALGLPEEGAQAAETLDPADERPQRIADLGRLGSRAAVAALVLAAKQALTRARWYAQDRTAQDWRSGIGTGLYGRTVGIVGASRTGRLVADRLRAFDVHVLLADPYLDAGGCAALGAELVGTDELFRRSDLVSIHAPALPETRHLVDARRLDLLRDGATLVNTARGSLVDTEALTRHCAAGRITAVLDVTDPEPLPLGHPLLHLPNVLVTPHLAGSQGHELRRLGEFTVSEVARFAGGEPLHGAIRMGDLHRIA
jgi:phosphoglycerate dehydrogenase-like enzyme